MHGLKRITIDGNQSTSSRPKPHAQCTECSQWKPINEQPWTARHMTHHRVGRERLRCNDCADDLKRKRQTSCDQEKYKCMACPDLKGRAAFQRSHMDWHRRDKQYLLVCSECHAREKEILEKLRSPQVWKCNKKCKCGSGHVDSCKAHPYWYGYARDARYCVTREDLKFIHFREKNKRYH
jgi:hypothetical protein